MAESNVIRRKSQLFLNNIAPVTHTYDELLKKKLKRGKFPGTKTGIIKIIGMLVLLFAIVFFIVQPEVCEIRQNWYPYLLPASCTLSLLSQLILFIIFSIGHTVDRPEFWIYLDIGITLVISITSMICSVITFTICQGSSSVKVGPSCGMAGSVILIISCGAIFLLFRYVEDEPISNPRYKSQSTSSTNDSIPRKSAYA